MSRLWNIIILKGVGLWNYKKPRRKLKCIFLTERSWSKGCRHGWSPTRHREVLSYKAPPPGLCSRGNGHRVRGTSTGTLCLSPLLWVKLLLESDLIGTTSASGYEKYGSHLISSPFKTQTLSPGPYPAAPWIPGATVPPLR